jgi:hypothetical protein
MIRFTVCLLFAFIAFCRADTWLADGQPVGAPQAAGDVALTNVTGGFNLRVHSATGGVFDASAQSIVSITLDSSTPGFVVPVPTNAFDGRKLQWRITAQEGDQTVTFPSPAFRIPSSASMSNTVTVADDTTSIFLTEYDAEGERWLITAYVWGY